MHGIYMHGKIEFWTLLEDKVCPICNLQKNIDKEYYYKLRQGGAGKPRITKIRILIKGKLNTNPVKTIDWNICWWISTVHKHVVMKYWNWWSMYCNKIVLVFKHIYILLTCKILSISDDALLLRAKRQTFLTKNMD